MKSKLLPVARERLHDRITRDLALNIIRGNLEVGNNTLTETDLSQRMKVSRTALRESVKVLAAKGLIEVRPKIGLSIRPRDDWNILDPKLLGWLCEAGMNELLVRDLCEVRLLIEPAAAELASLRGNAEEVKRIVECYLQMADSVRNPDVHDPLDLQFHTLILNASHNALIRQMNAMIAETLRAILNVTKPLSEVFMEKSVKLHGEVAFAIQGRDSKAARLSMEKIVKQAAKDIGRSLNIQDVSFNGLTSPDLSANSDHSSQDKLRTRKGLRRLSRKDLEQLRLRAIQEVQRGEAPEPVARRLGMNRTTIYDWLARYRSQGLDGLKTKPISGRPSKLSESQCQTLLTKLAESSPIQWESRSRVWTLAETRRMVLKEFGVTFSLGSVKRLLVNLGLPTQGPLTEFRKTLPDWVRTEYPKLVAESKETGAEIFFETVGASYFMKAACEAHEFQPTDAALPRLEYRFLCATSMRAAHFFMVLADGAAGGKYAQFLQNIVTERDRPIFLVRLDSDDQDILAGIPEKFQRRIRLINLRPQGSFVATDQRVPDRVRV